MDTTNILSSFDPLLEHCIAYFLTSQILIAQAKQCLSRLHIDLSQSGYKLLNHVPRVLCQPSRHIESIGALSRLLQSLVWPFIVKLFLQQLARDAWYNCSCLIDQWNVQVCSWGLPILTDVFVNVPLFRSQVSDYVFRGVWPGMDAPQILSI